MNTPELSWFKSSHSSASGDDCVEVAVTPATVHIRDSKDKQGHRLAFKPDTWADFLAHARRQA